MEQYADLKKVETFIRSEFTTTSISEKRDVCIFDQSGYDFTCEHFEGYLHPSDYNDIVNNMNFLSS